MKKIFKYMLLLITVSTLMIACDDDPSGDSIFVMKEKRETPFDIWLKENFLYTYNLQFIYQWDDKETDFTYELVPPKIEESRNLARLIKFMWSDPYEEILNNPTTDVNEGEEFLGLCAPRMIYAVGSGAFNADNTETLGVAEGGLKVTLYKTNMLSEFLSDPDFYKEALDQYFIRTIHHEFGHILHQTKEYPTAFKTISKENYKLAEWSIGTEESAMREGFVSMYSRKSEDEDFCEILSFYATTSDAEWSTILTIADSPDEDGIRYNGSVAILQKLEILKTYMREAWDVDVEELRQNIKGRYARLSSINFNEEDVNKW